MESVPLESIDQQIADLQRQRAEQLQVVRQQQQLTAAEQLHQKTLTRNESLVTKTRQLWPSGAVILKELLAQQLELRDTEAKYKEQAQKLRERMTNTQDPGFLEQQQLATLQQEVKDLYKRKTELRRNMVGDTRLSRVFKADYQQQFSSAMKTANKLRGELQKLADVSEVVRRQPEKDYTPSTPVQAAVQQLDKIIDEIGKYVD